MAKTNKKIKEDLKGMKADEMKRNLSALREELRTLRFKAEGSRSKNVKEEAGIKKNIARVMTALSINK
jgi:ribosomal protein L29